MAVLTGHNRQNTNGSSDATINETAFCIYSPPTPFAQDINERLINHPLSKKLKLQSGISASRPHARAVSASPSLNLTGATLLGENKIEVPPLNFAQTHIELPTLVQIFYLGSAVCGHPGIVHGGMLATLLDEGLARACFPALPNKIGMTANLTVNYRLPCPVESFLVLRAETTKVVGRKAWAKGWIELLTDDGTEGRKLVDAEGLFVEPRDAAKMPKNLAATD